MNNDTLERAEHEYRDRGVHKSANFANGLYNNNTDRLVSQEFNLTAPKTPNTASSKTLELRATERALVSKLAYEWRGIFRALMKTACSKETEGGKKGEVTIKEFNQICLRHHVNFTREEIN